MSCNGCRVLRKGCSDACVLRSSLHWIESPEAQGHATLFVAKFFGRAAMMSFISAVPESQRPPLFQSLLYEACGRTVNPVFGAVGLLWSGNWGLCQGAVETVLKGGSLRPAASSSIAAFPSKLAQSAACKSDVPPASSQPTISFNPFLQMPLSAQPAPPNKRARLCAQQQQQEEVSNATAETACLSDDRPNGVISKPAGHHSSCNLPSAPCGHATKFAASDLAQPIHAPVPRRANPTLPSLSSLSSGRLQDQAFHDKIEGPQQAGNSTIQLDLTLSSHGDHADVGIWANSLPSLMKVSSPSSFSVNSEGSVTNSDTAEYTMSRLTSLSAQAHHHAEDLKLLHLL